MCATTPRHALLDQVGPTRAAPIANTTTASGLKVKARLDRRRYRTKVKVPNATMRALAITPRRFHGEWNYKISPHAHA